MPIVRPEPVLSRSERRLVALLSRLLLSLEQPTPIGSNRSSDSIPLTDNNLRELQRLLDQFLSSDAFETKSLFVENLFCGGRDWDGYLRKIYFRERARRGRPSRVRSGKTWADFKSRIGVELALPHARPVIRMTFEHFLKMEEKLFRAWGLGERTIRILVDFVRQRHGAIENARSIGRRISRVSIRECVIDPVVIYLRQIQRSPDREIPISRISSIMVLVCNLGALFTTLDWGVTGVISALAAALPGAMST